MEGGQNPLRRGVAAVNFPFMFQTKMDLFKILIDRMREMLTGFVRMLPQLAIACAMLLVTWGIAHVIRSTIKKLTTRTRLRPSLVALFATLAGVAVWTIGILISLAVIVPGVNAGSLITILGFGSVAIGFAFRDIFENFLAGVLIMLRRKMRIGDLIECEGIEGRVEQTTLRETYLRRLDNQLTIVPNSLLFKYPVRILTDAKFRRYEIVVGVAYDTDLDRVADIIAKAVSPLEGVNIQKPIEIYASCFADSAIEFTVRWWAGSKQLDLYQSRDRVVRAIKRAFDEAGIEIPFPQRAHWFKEPFNPSHQHGT